MSCADALGVVCLLPPPVPPFPASVACMLGGTRDTGSGRSADHSQINNKTDVLHFCFPAMLVTKALPHIGASRACSLLVTACPTVAGAFGHAAHQEQALIEMVEAFKA